MLLLLRYIMDILSYVVFITVMKQDADKRNL